MDVCIILGSKSDMPVCDKCTMILSNLDISYSAHIASAHRTPKHLESVIENAIKGDIIIQAGSWFSYKSEKISQGRENLRLLLKKDKKIRESIETEVKLFLGYE